MYCMNILNKYILNENIENEYIYSLFFKAIFPYNWNLPTTMLWFLSKNIYTHYMKVLKVGQFSYYILSNFTTALNLLFSFSNCDAISPSNCNHAFLQEGNYVDLA